MVIHILLYRIIVGLLYIKIEQYPNISYFDIGSGFDIMCGKNSRGWKHIREDEIKYYKNLFPSDWT